MMALFELPFPPDTPAPATWTAALGPADGLARRMKLQLERERVEAELARVKATLRASTAERRRMAQACRDMSARQVPLRIKQDRVFTTEARGWILVEMREQLELLIMKDSISELGEASPFYNDLNWRRIGHRASDERLAELCEKLKATEPRKRTHSAPKRRTCARATDGETYERIGEIYERYESSERKSAPAKKIAGPDVAATAEPASATKSGENSGPWRSRNRLRRRLAPEVSREAAPLGFAPGGTQGSRGKTSNATRAAKRRLFRARQEALLRRIVTSESVRARRHATRAAVCQAGSGGTCLRTAA
ncbi:MAG: hypothetical protein IPK87_00505 [Planctomycetes bacterium]|nr:hypothetical protein [Planctomycetota bacterium]